MLICQRQSVSTSHLTGATRDVYETLIRLTAPHKSICQENLNLLVTKSGYCRRMVQRAIRELEDRHLLRVERCYDKQGRPLANRYRLLGTKVGEI